MYRLPGALARLVAGHFLAVSRMFRPCYAPFPGQHASLAGGPAVAAPGLPRYRWLVSDRRAAGARIPGQPAVSEQSAARDSASYPGQRFGLPEEGPRSVAGVGRRLGALIIDWLACLLITAAILRSAHHTTVLQHGIAVHRDISFSLALAQARGWTLGLFAVEQFVLTALTGFTLGKRLLGIRVARLDGSSAVLSSLVRTALLLLVVPPLVLDKDLRGLHDKAARTVVIRL